MERLLSTRPNTSSLNIFLSFNIYGVAEGVLCHNLLIKSLFSSKWSKHHNFQTDRAREMTF